MGFEPAVGDRRNRPRAAAPWLAAVLLLGVASALASGPALRPPPAVPPAGSEAPAHLPATSPQGDAASPAPPESAPIAGPFGTRVGPGDADYAAALTVVGTPALCRADLGEAGLFADDGLYVVWPGPDGIRPGTLRLVAAAGAPAGSLVADADVAERLAAADCDASPAALYADGNGNGHYDPEDRAYLSAGPAAGLRAPDAATAPDTWTVRVGGGTAGSLVRAGDADLVAFGASAPALAGASLGFVDVDASGHVTEPDRVWLTPGPAASGQPVPLGSVRLR